MATLWYEPCTITARHEVFYGYQWESDGDYFYHHTEYRNLDSVANANGLRPSEDPWDDGVVNFTLNENYHRFGSIRLVFDRDLVMARARVRAMCYVWGDEDRKLGRFVDDITEPERRAGRLVNRARIEAMLGIESGPVWWSEAKHYTRDPVPLETLAWVEYWMPWQPDVRGSASVGSNVSPCRGLWSTWDSGLGDAVGLVMGQIDDVREFTDVLGLALRLRSCYPYASLNHDQALVFDEANLALMRDGVTPPLVSRYGLPEAKCTCPPEDLPKPKEVV